VSCESVHPDGQPCTIPGSHIETHGYQDDRGQWVFWNEAVRRVSSPVMPTPQDITEMMRDVVQPIRLDQGLYHPLSSASASHSANAQEAYPEIVRDVLDILRANPPRTGEWDDWHAETTVPWLHDILEVPRLTLGAVLHTMEHEGLVFRLWNYVGTARSSSQPYVADEFRNLITDQPSQIMPLSPLPANALLNLIYEEATCSEVIQKIIDDHRVEQAGQRRSNRPARIIFRPGPPPT